MWQNFVNELLFPSVVALLASLLSFAGTYVSTRQTKQKEKIDQTVTLIDNLILHLSKLINSIDSLSSDTINLGYFSFLNIRRARVSVDALRGYLWNIYLFENSQFRTQISEAIDSADELIGEVDFLENHPLNESEKATIKKKEIQKEFREMRIALLQHEIFIDENNGKARLQANNPPKGAEADKLQTVDKVTDGLLKLIGDLDENIKVVNEKNEKKRPLLATRLVDLKAKLSGLNRSLQDEKAKFS